MSRTWKDVLAASGYEDTDTVKVRRYCAVCGESFVQVRGRFSSNEAKRCPKHQREALGIEIPSLKEVS